MNELFNNANYGFNPQTSYGVADFSGSGAVGNPLGQIFSNMSLFGGYGNYGLPSSLNSGLGSTLGSSQGSPNYAKQLKQLVSQGIISEAEYKAQLRKSYGFGASEGDERTTGTTTQNPVAILTGEELKKARQSNTGTYKVTAKHSETVSKTLEDAVKILKKDPEMVTENEIQEIEKMFDNLNKNPMLAEAFIKEANNADLSGSGKTKTLLGRFEQVLTKHYGQKVAKEKIQAIKEKLGESVESRDSESWSDFKSKSNDDVKNVEYSFGDKVSNNPDKALVYGTGGAAILAGAGYMATRRKLNANTGVPELTRIAKGTRFLGKWGLVALAALAIGNMGVSAYKTITSESK